MNASHDHDAGRRVFRYLSRRDVEAVGLPMSELIDVVETALVEKAMGRTRMPSKHWIEYPERWYDGMSSVVPSIGTAVMKWQSGSPGNAGLGLPYLTGMLFLNDTSTGVVEAVMDSTWIAQERTAAATALTVKHLHPAARNFAMLGCGVQGHSHLAALRVVMPNLEEVVIFDIDDKAAEGYSRAVQDAGLRAVVADNAEEAVRQGEIVVTAGPIQVDAPRTIQPGWLQPGALAVPIDFDSYWSVEAINEVDLLVTDDFGQFDHLRDDGYFVDCRKPDSDIGAIACALHRGRQSADERIMSINMGVSVEDATTARSILTRARALGVGQELPL